MPAAVHQEPSKRLQMHLQDLHTRSDNEFGSEVSPIRVHKTSRRRLRRCGHTPVFCPWPFLFGNTAVEEDFAWPSYEHSTLPNMTQTTFDSSFNR